MAVILTADHLKKTKPLLIVNLPHLSTEWVIHLRLNPQRVVVRRVSVVVRKLQRRASYRISQWARWTHVHRWHHVGCGCIDPDTLLGFELLSSDKKDMVLRYITKAGSSSHKMSQSPRKTFQSQEGSSYPPTIEHAKSGRSTCKARGCREKIAKGELRIGFSRDRDGYIYTRWHHVRCAGK